MYKKILIGIGITILFLGTSITPIVAIDNVRNFSIPIYDKTVIIVDDEGDGDYTSIQEAINNANPGDTIEVYSGTYPEDEIQITKENLILIGIDHELGGGNDSGKPFIIGIGNNGVVKIIASYVTVSNFNIEATGGVISTCIWVRATVVYEQDNITISDCILRNLISISLSTYGIRVEAANKNISIMNNEICNCSVGINSWSSPNGLEITDNVITDCEVGISLGFEQQNVSGNKIRRCSRNGIQIHGTNNSVYQNDIENCPIGIYSTVSEPGEEERGNTITKNNFKKYSVNELWWGRQVILFPFNGLVKDMKDRWIGNYWDTWLGFGPQRIRGILVLGIRFGEGGIAFGIPRNEYDWHPALEPYDIDV
jgi:hypothetical protein